MAPDIGLSLLNLFGSGRLPLDYQRHKRNFDSSVPLAKDLRDRNQLKSIATYREYIMDWPDRFCVDAAIEAEKLGADIRLFTKASIRAKNSDGLWQVDLDSELRGMSSVFAPVILNLAGTGSMMFCSPCSKRE